MLFHNHLTPIAFSIGPLSIRWYGVGFAIAFLLGEWSVRKMLERDQFPYIDTSRLMISGLIGTVVGARIFHCVFYEPAYYLANPIKIFAVWEGGLASHGGVLGLVIALALTTRNLPKGSFLSILDRATIASAFGGAIVRVANFANSEILGTPTSGNFGVVFDAVDQIARHPVQLYESTSYLLLSTVLLSIYWITNKREQRGFLTGVFMMGIFSARMFLEPFKMPQTSIDNGFLASMGQTLSIPFVVVGLILVVRSRRRVTSRFEF
jgi:prolipoprotein diacylglyceryl transferase